MRGLLLAVLLLAGCVPAPAPAGKPDSRFDAAWQAARPWSELAPALRHTYAQPEGDADELLLSAMLWPEKSDLHPELTPHPAWPEELRPGRARQVAEGMAAWRQRAITGRAWALELAGQPAGSGAFAFSLPLKPGRHLWMPMPLGSEDWVDRAPDHGRIVVRSAVPVDRVRVVFRLDDLPQPTQVYRHGDEITVAAWGVALRLQALQALDARQRSLRLWFAPAQ